MVTIPHHTNLAVTRVLSDYMREGCDTVDKIITRWASKNAMTASAYIAGICSKMGIDPHATLNHAYIPKLVDAIVRYENDT